MFPNRSTFRSSTPDSLWWWFKNPARESADNNQWHLGVADGFALLHGLAVMLRLRLQSLGGELQTFGGGSVSSDEIDLSGVNGWDRTLLQALYAVIRHDRPYDQLLLDTIKADADLRRISPRTAAAAIWFAYYSTTTRSSGGIEIRSVGSQTTVRQLEGSDRIDWNHGAPEQIRLDPDALLPVFGWPMTWTGVHANDTDLPVIGVPFPGQSVTYALNQRARKGGPHPLLLLGGTCALLVGLYALTDR